MNKKHEAQHIYMTGCKTQREIAEMVGVSERTIHSWIHQYAWDKLRLAAFTAPVTIADNICSQIVELQNAIARKEPGCRYPSLAEAEIMRKLIVCLEKMKKTPSLSQNMQILETFRNYVRPIDKEFTHKLSGYTEKFLAAKSVNGFAPYQAEYGVEPVAPVSHFYDEVPDENESDNQQQPCSSNNNCLHKGDCTYPKCLHPERYAAPVDPITNYSVSPVCRHATAMTLGHIPEPEIDSPAEENSSFPAMVNEETTSSKFLITQLKEQVTPPFPSQPRATVEGGRARATSSGNIPATPQSEIAGNATNTPPQTLVETSVLNTDITNRQKINSSPGHNRAA